MRENQSSPLPLYCEVLPDWDKGRLLLEEGHIKKVYGSEALKIWVKKALMPDCARYRYEAYTPKYGHDLSWLLGRPMSETMPDLVSAAVCDALYANPYITKVTRLESNVSGSTLSLTFEIETVYDTFNISEVYRL